MACSEPLVIRPSDNPGTGRNYFSAAGGTFKAFLLSGGGTSYTANGFGFPHFVGSDYIGQTWRIIRDKTANGINVSSDAVYEGTVDSDGYINPIGEVFVDSTRICDISTGDCVGEGPYESLAISYHCEVACDPLPPAEDDIIDGSGVMLASVSYLATFKIVVLLNTSDV